MQYPVILTPDEGGFVVTFPDIPEAITQGDDKADALRHAADALESALDFYFETKRAVPLPSRARRDQAVVDLSASVTATVLLYNELLRQNVRPAELAQRMHIPKQSVTRLLDRRHATKIDSMSEALKALGKRLEVRVS